MTYPDPDRSTAAAGDRPGHRGGVRADRPSPAAQRLAAALGWERVPALSADQVQQARAKLEAAQAEARRIYNLGEAA